MSDTVTYKNNMSLCVRKPTIWVPTRSNKNLYCHRWLEAGNFSIKEEKGLYYPSSENKGVDQLRSYCEADLRLCFRICRLFLHVAAHIVEKMYQAL